MRKIRAISLFSGCGGADLGLIGGFSYLTKKYTQSCVDIIHASDINKRAVDTYNLNFDNKAIECDIHKLSFPIGHADLVIGGFPCQAFSTVNPTKQPHNRNNQLFWEMARIIEEVKPTVFIAENVKGFLNLEKGKYFKLAKKVFEKNGYMVHHKLLDASNFGIPQRRERLVMVGIINDLQISFKFPEPTHGSGKKPKIPLKIIISDLIPSDPKYYFSKRAVEGVKKAKPNMKRALAQDLNRQCLTITSHLAKVSLNSRDPVLLVDPEKELYRRFTPKEAAGIQSFPENFVFSGTDGDAYRQIGNAIPPVLMWNVMQSIIRQVFNKRSD